MKNRLPDVLPYDHNRVELPTTKDDYINASRIGTLSVIYTYVYKTLQQLTKMLHFTRKIYTLRDMRTGEKPSISLEPTL